MNYKHCITCPIFTLKTKNHVSNISTLSISKIFLYKDQFSPLHIKPQPFLLPKKTQTMLSPQIIHHQTQSTKTLLPFEKPFLHGTGRQSFLLRVQPTPSSLSNRQRNLRIGSKNNIKASLISNPFNTKKTVSVKAVVTVKRTVGSIISDVTLSPSDIKDLFGRSLLVELVSTELDPGETIINKLNK